MPVRFRYGLPPTIMTQATKQQISYLKKHLRYTIKEQPRFAILAKRLLDIGGLQVVPLKEEDLESLIERGRVLDGRKAERVRGLPCRCHGNVCNIYENSSGIIRIMTGWALSKDGLWRQHSWGFNTQSNRVVETTARRTKYYGFELTDEESDQFVLDNP